MKTETTKPIYTEEENKQYRETRDRIKTFLRKAESQQKELKAKRKDTSMEVQATAQWHLAENRERISAVLDFYLTLRGKECRHKGKEGNETSYCYNRAYKLCAEGELDNIKLH